MDLPADPAPERALGAAGLSGVVDRLGLVEEQVAELAARRGNMRAQPDATPEQIREIDQKLQELLEQNAPAIAAKPGALERLHTEACRIQESQRLTTLQEEITRISARAGEAQARLLDQGALERADQELAEYLDSQKDLFERYPGLADCVVELSRAAEQAGVARRLDADHDAIKIYKALVGLRKDHAAVCNVLAGLGDSERQLLSEAYQQRYGKDVVETIERAFGGVKQQMIRNLLASDGVAAAADGICLALDALPMSRAAALHKVLLEIDPATLPAVRANFEARYAARFEAASLDEVLDLKLKRPQRDELKALLANDRDLAAALKVEQELSGTTKRALVLYRTLEAMSAQEIDGMQAAYRRRFGCELRDYLERLLPQGAQKDRTLALLDGDQIKAYAARLRCRLMGHKGEWIGGPFQNGDIGERLGVIKVYNEMYGRDFWKDLKKGLRKRDYDLMEPLIKHGEVSSAVLLYHCMLGFGTDEGGIVKILSKASKAEIEEIKRSYAAHYKYRDGTGRDLVRDLRMELSGDSLFDIMELMRGAPESSQELHDRMLSRFEHERSGSLIRRIDFFTKEGKIMDVDVRAASDYYKAHIEDRTPSPRQELRFRALAGLAGQDFDSFRNIKIWVANNAANMTAGTVAGGITFLTVTLGAPLAVIVAAAGASSMVARALMKLQIKGGAYGREEIIRDTLFAAIDGGTLFMGRLLSNVLAQKTVKMAASMGLKQAIGLTQYIDRARTSEHIIAGSEYDVVVDPKNPMASVAGGERQEAYRDELDDSFDGIWRKALGKN